MVTFLGFLTIGLILTLLLTQRVSAVVALAGVPVVTALLAGFGPGEIGTFVSDGLSDVVGVTAMFVFAIVYFGVMRDAGLFDPVVRRLVALAGNAPTTVCLATTALAMAAHLDGAGATTFLITIPAMLPLFDRLGMSRLTLTVCVGMGAGTMNILPWGGPTARAATTAGVDANEVWVPLIPAQLAGMVVALLIAWYLGRRESRREPVREAVRAAAGADPAAGGRAVGVAVEGSAASVPVAPSRDTGTAGPEGAAEPASTGRPGTRNRTGRESTTGAERSPDDGGATTEAEPSAVPARRVSMAVNVVLTLLTVAGLVSGVAAPEFVFLCAVVLALVINFPGLSEQTERINAQAPAAMLMASTLLAAGAFLGILEGSGMIDAMAVAVAQSIPDGVGGALPVVVGVLGVPLSLVFGPDAYYFGVLPVLTAVGAEFGVSAVDLARASVVGQETVGFPISPMTGSFYLLVGLAGVDIGRHIRALFGWAWLISLVMLGVALATGVVMLG
ncbi:SLC13 family permease [Pseudonocardia sp. NPDC049635]|uniref:CitMHS family transporter n=1 Tax=Pseudonocardia sp. NPDC049635 TaxID=3155506 RepID=UPI0033ECE7CE